MARRAKKRIVKRPPSKRYRPRRSPLQTDPLSVPSVSRPSNNLPIQVTSFIGREREIAEIKQALLSTHLLTLTGSGGCGKTRLALQVAASLLDSYADGIWLVELASLSNPALVPKAVASALNVPEQPGRRLHETLAGYLRFKHLLLVLDNCEHVLSACQDLADGLLRTCPNLRILATSRQALGMDGELTYRVPSLQLPNLHRLPPFAKLVEYEAVRLFAERAAFSQEGFTLTASNGSTVTQICHRLDGIPLAIEFAAARVKVLSVDQIASRLNDRFRLLTAGTRKTLPRHQTLQAMMDWSYGLLSEQERTLLRRLSVFAGGWTLEAAEAICSGNGVEQGDILDLLTQLVDKSLVAVETQGSEARYRLLETIRQYGRDRLQELGEADDVKRRHRDWYLALAEQASRELQGPRQQLWLERLETEHDNLRAALERSKAEEDGAEPELRLAGALYWFWWFRGYWSEARGWLEEALNRRRDAPRAVLPRAYWGAMDFALGLGDDERAKRLGEEGLAIARELGDKRLSAGLLIWLGVVATHQMAYDEAAELFEEAVRLAGEAEEKWLVSLCLSQQGILARVQGDLGLATDVHEEAVALMRETGDAAMVSYTLRCRGIVALKQDDYQRAAESFTESLRLSRETGFRWITAECLVGLAGVSSAHGQLTRAARLYGAAEALREAIGHRPSPQDQADYDRRLASTRRRRREAAFAAAWAEGRAMTLEQAIECALVSSEPPRKPKRTEKRAIGKAVGLLTPREREVAALIAQGLTNRKIASQLVISQRTADGHVQHILNKFGFDSRAQIAAWAVEHGLQTSSSHS